MTPTIPLPDGKPSDLGVPTDDPILGVPTDDPIASAFAEAAKNISTGDCIRSVHAEALALLRRAGFNVHKCRGGDCPSQIRRIDGSLSTVFVCIFWKGTGDAKRTVCPELVTQLQARAEGGMCAAKSGHPEDRGASTLQLEIIHGMQKILNRTNPDDCGLWLRMFFSDKTKVIRIPICKGKYTEGELVIAELRFWDSFPHSALAKPI